MVQASCDGARIVAGLQAVALAAGGFFPGVCHAQRVFQQIRKLLCQHLAADVVAAQNMILIVQNDHAGVNLLHDRG